jgi:hypothetical protein
MILYVIRVFIKFLEFILMEQLWLILTSPQLFQTILKI